jgi:hypothetical protein
VTAAARRFDGRRANHYADIADRHKVALVGAAVAQRLLTVDQKAEIADGLGARVMDLSPRRRAEQAVADYLEREILPNNLRFQRLWSKLAGCRRCGVVGYRPGDGRVVVAWDAKCGNVRLCPDEAVQETERLCKHYLEDIHTWATLSPLHRLYYVVASAPNFEAGRLRHGKRAMFDAFTMLRGQFSNIKGALVVQEDPLSVHDDWNVHLNAILLVRGEFSYSALHDAWSALWHREHIDIHVAELPKTGNADSDRTRLSDALHELIKYCTKLTAEQLPEREKDGPGAHGPPLVEWPAARFIEWIDAQHRFRRTRAYGVLHAIEQRRWNAAKPSQRYEWIKAAYTYAADVDASPWSTWCDLDERTKVVLRRAMREGAKDETPIVWCGKVSWDQRRGLYAVDLIPGDNFFESSAGIGRETVSDAWARGP